MALNEEYNLGAELAPEELGAGGDNPQGADKVPSDFAEMRRKYPYLAEELNKVEKEMPGLYTREFCMIDADEARKLDRKIKKQRAWQLKLEHRRHKVFKEVAKELFEVAKMH